MGSKNKTGAKKDIVIQSGQSFEELMKKALNTPQPKKEKKSKKK